MTLDILINGLRVDILDRSSINLRLNNVLYNPTEINSKLAEYSFSFNLPTTPNNNKIFGYANVLAKNNKFGTVYNCEVYSDEILIFTGSLRVQSIQRGFYNVNLVNIKINTVDTIFGDMKMNEIDWKIPFIGASSINVHNADANSKVLFPLVSYGAFLKSPSSTEFDYNQYTSKFEIDKYNKWYYESFVPSPNLIELVKRAFNLKGYNVHGNIFNDKIANNIYISENLADDLIPTYNLALENIGKVKINTEFSNYVNKNSGLTNGAPFIEHNLSYPYQSIGGNWNFPSVDIYDLWSNENSKITRDTEHYLFDDFSNCIIIPADGLYKMKLTVNANIPALTLEALQWWLPDRSENFLEKTITIENDLRSDMPIEIQVVKNEDECELIHGSLQWEYVNGDRQYRQDWYTAYPHENLYYADNPTVNNAQYSSSTSSSRFSESTGGRRTSRPSTNNKTTRRSRGASTRVPTGETVRGYMPKDGLLLAYDPWVSENFIMGLSSIGQGTPSVIKNGYSWNPAISVKNINKYTTNGYYKLTSLGRPASVYTWTLTNFNKNELANSPTNSITVSDKSMSGTVSSIVYLHRNDVIMLKALARHWYNSNTDIYYKFNCTVDFELEAYSPLDLANPDWNLKSLFDYDLQIGHFLNKETKVSDFILNFIKEFNLEYINEGKDVYLNKLNFNINESKYCINIDNRVNEGESQVIEYPGTMQVKYKIDTDEWGFELTVPSDKLNDPNWKDYGEYGSDKTKMSNNETEENILLTTSYTYYDTFKIMNDDGTIKGEITIPVISKFSYMIDGYSYEESMKVDGKGLPIRYWFRGDNTGYQVKVNGKYPVFIYNTKNRYEGIDLSYYNKKGTLLNNYFNMQPNIASNYVSVNCYLGATEYKLLKGGANVLFDSDIYIVSEIQGYDPSGINTTELILLKK